MDIHEPDSTYSPPPGCTGTPHDAELRRDTMVWDDARLTTLNSRMSRVNVTRSE